MTRKWASASPPATPIATVGDFGGRSTPALYFEIRKAGRPIDPQALVQERRALSPKGPETPTASTSYGAPFSDGPIDVLRKLHGAIRSSWSARCCRARLSISLFENTGKLLWSSAASTNPDLFALVLQAIAQLEDASAGKRAKSTGQHCALPDDGPAYLFWLRDGAGSLAAIVAVVCNRHQGRCRRAAVLLRARSPEAGARAAAPRPAGARRHRHAQRVAERARQGPGAAAVGDRQSSAGERRRRPAESCWPTPPVI